MGNVKDVKKQVAKTKVVTVYDFMKSRHDMIQNALPSHVTADRLIGIFEMVIKSNSVLRSCTQASLISAIIQTAQLGLIPGNINHCYYVPFKNKQPDGSYQNEVQFILGYRGLIELVNRCGKAIILNAECVYANDYFDYEFGLNPRLEHKPIAGNRGEIIGCYCVAKNLVANEKVFVYLQKEEIDKVRNASKAGQSEYSPWAKWYEEMAKKTVIKRICKLLPLSVDAQKQISTDETIKHTIAKDMTEEKDDTVWEEAEVVKEPAEEEPKDK